MRIDYGRIIDQNPVLSSPLYAADVGYFYFGSHAIAQTGLCFGFVLSAMCIGGAARIGRDCKCVMDDRQVRGILGGISRRGLRNRCFAAKMASVHRLALRPGPDPRTWVGLACSFYRRPGGVPERGGYIHPIRSLQSASSPFVGKMEGAMSIRSVLVYKGHVENALLGPYGDNIAKQIDMFHTLNRYRKESGRTPWTVTPIAGEKLIGALETCNPGETLLVIPAGQSSHLDKVFSATQTAFIRTEFLKRGGGRLYATCGASYMMSSVREYDGLSTQHPDKRELTVKKSTLPLFDGIARGPLCPFPGKKYQVGFYSDAVTVTSGQENCTVYLSGGGSFFPSEIAQKINVLVNYLDTELHRLKKPADWGNAAILGKVGNGSVLLSMFHPYYGPNDIDVEKYEAAFPDCGTNWRAMKESLSPLDERMRFVLNAMLNPLEDSS